MNRALVWFGLGALVGGLLGALVAGGPAGRALAQAPETKAAVSVLLVDVPQNTPGWATLAPLNTLSILTFEDRARGTVCYMVNPTTMSCAKR